MRDGVLTHRPGVEWLCELPVNALMQGAYLYEPSTSEFPYVISQIGGRTFKTLADVTPPVTTEITIPGDPNPPNIEKAFLCQGEEFLIIQDGVSLPLIWDGVVLRRSRGPSTVLGIANASFMVPGVGSSVLVTLTAPFSGVNGQIVYVDGKKFTASTAASGNWINLRNDSNGSGGATQPAGATVRKASTTQTVIQSQFIIPAIGSSVIVPVDPNFPLATPTTVGITNDTLAFTVLDETPPAVGANEIFLVNVTGIPGDTADAGSNLESEGELPAGQAMDYYMGRIWIANGRQYLAGDIVGSRASGSAAYGYRDSILKMTENAFTVSGGAFTVPSNAGNIRALKHPANLDTALGEGQLMPFTRRVIYSTNITPTRAEWALLEEPIQRVAQINFGTVSDRSVVTVNADMYYRSVDGVRSFSQALRYFNSGPGNTPISHEMERLFPLDDKALLKFCSGIEFDNRLLMTALPYQTPAGVAHKASGVLNFDLLNSINEKAPPAWEGAWEGLNVLQWLKGDFGGRQRAFAIVWSDLNQAIEIWEQSADALEDRIADAQVDPSIPNSEHSRIQWSWESPSLSFGKDFEMKQLDGLELWLDRLSGTVDIAVEYRPSSYGCWIFWSRLTECAARNECELPNPLMPCNHPTQEYLPQYRQLLSLPIPPVICNENMSRPSNQDYSFQIRVTLRGSCRIRGYMMYATPRDRAPYENLRCP